MQDDKTKDEIAQTVAKHTENSSNDIEPSVTQKNSANPLQSIYKKFTSFQYPEKPFSHLLVALGILLVISLIISLATLFCVPEDILAISANCTSYPLVIILNTLPIFTLTAILYCICGKCIFSGLLTLIFFVIVSAIHMVKLALRNEPLLPTDTALIDEAYTILLTYPTYQFILIGVAFVATIVLLVLVYRHCKEAVLPIWLRGGLCLLLISLFFTSTSIYKNQDVYASFPTDGSPNSINNQYEARGLVYSFLYQLYVEKKVVSETYDSPTFASLEAAPQIDSNQTLPHIIMIMGEAFSDLTDNPHLDFSKTRDPLEAFKSMQNSDNGFGGKIVVPGYGGGTANTEFDVLTGLSTSLLDRPLASYEYIEAPVDALPRRLQTIGYETLAIHPGYAWFYSRNLAYPRLGFETAYFLEDSFDLETQGIGGYVNETATMDKIIDTFATHLETSDAPLFSFTVTIQNHGPYESRFGPIADHFTSDVALTDFEYDLLNQYSKGITDADLQLERLRDYVAELDEPVVIVYYGDHLPCFTNGKDFFDILEYPINSKGNYEEQLAVYEVPFVVWGNDAAIELSNIRENAMASNLPEDGIISAHYLTPLIAEVLHMDGLSPYFDYSYDLLGALPIATKNIYKESDGTYAYEPSSTVAESLEHFLSWQHYKVTDDVVDALDFLDIIPENSFVPVVSAPPTYVSEEVTEEVSEDIIPDETEEILSEYEASLSPEETETLETSEDNETANTSTDVTSEMEESLPLEDTDNSQNEGDFNEIPNDFLDVYADLESIEMIENEAEIDVTSASGTIE